MLLVPCMLLASQRYVRVAVSMFLRLTVRILRPGRSVVTLKFGSVIFTTTPLTNQRIVAFGSPCPLQAMINWSNELYTTSSPTWFCTTSILCLEPGWKGRKLETNDGASVERRKIESCEADVCKYVNTHHNLSKQCKAKVGKEEGGGARTHFGHVFSV